MNEEMLDIEENELRLVSIEQAFSDVETLIRKERMLSEIDDLGVYAEQVSPLSKNALALVSHGTNLQIGIESVRTSLSSLYQKVLDALAKAWDYLILYTDTAYAQTTALLNRISNMTDNAKDRLSGKPTGATINVGNSLGTLTYEYKKLNGKDFLGKLKEFSTASEKVMIDHVVEVMVMSRHITPLIESMVSVDTSDADVLTDVKNDAKMVARFGNEVTENVVQMRGEDLGSSRPDLLSNNHHSSVKQVATLLGNKSIYAKYGNVDKASLRSEGVPFFNALQTVFSTTLTLENSDTSKELPKDTTLETLSPDDVIMVMEALEDIIEVVRKFKVRYDKDMKVMRKNYQKLRNKANVNARSGDNTEINLYLRRVAMAANGLTRWTYDPFIPLVSLSLRVVRATLTYAENSLTKYPVK